MHAKFRNPVLDIFRAIACLWVVLHHGHANIAHPEFIKNILDIGWLGVDLFFILSGFLIFGLLSNADPKYGYRHFYIRRVFKIFPQCFSLVLLIYVLYLLGHVAIPEHTHIVYYLLFIQNYFPRIIPLSHTWSLCTEEWFYLSLPLLLMAAKHIAVKYDIPLWLCYAITLLIPIMLCDATRYAYLERYAHFTPEIAQETHFTIAGIFYGCLFRCLHDTGVFASFRNRCIGWCSIILTASAFYYFLHYNISIWYGGDLVWLCFGTLLSVCHASRYWEHACSKLRYMLIIGRSSYGIYIWHLPLLLLRDSFFHAPASFVGGWIYCLGYALTAVVVGHISTLLLENYFLKLREKYYPAHPRIIVSNP